jgi:hypothetical protein
LVDADLMIAFISNAFMASDNCRKEMSYALSKKKKVINIFLEETALSPGMELQLGNIFAIMKYTYPSEGYFYSKLYGAELLGTEITAARTRRERDPEGRARGREAEEGEGKEKAGRGEKAGPEKAEEKVGSCP